MQPVNIGMTSSETLRERYNETAGVPLISGWRNNLTALSKRYNLYFVAIQDHINVFTPTFPYQKLGSTPRLRMALTLANSFAHGYIDPRIPHAVNHLTVADLGQEEILLLSTDSGNVVAYHTRVVQQAITMIAQEAEPARIGYVWRLRPFFRHWVRESAWGLSVHKEARMIAVSANVPHHVDDRDPCAKITVFAFALKSRSPRSPAAMVEDAGDGEEELGWHVWKADKQPARCLSRDLNYKIILGCPKGHMDNIPNISFVNSDEDRDGRWLFSTDIGGKMKAWDIWQAQCIKTWNLTGTTADSWRAEAARFNWANRHATVERGWLVAALDPNAFRVTESTRSSVVGRRPLNTMHTSAKATISPTSSGRG